MVTKCSCGLGHEHIAEMLAQLHPDPLVDVTTPEGTWRVPRIFIGAHGLAAVDLPALAVRYDWERVSPI